MYWSAAHTNMGGKLPAAESVLLNTATAAVCCLLLFVVTLYNVYIQPVMVLLE